jgi:hypothetical protein
VDGVDENVASTTFTSIRFSSLLDVENVCLESNNTLSDVDVEQLTTIKTKIMAWKPHSCIFIC